MIKNNKKYLLISTLLMCSIGMNSHADDYAHSIFVPRQLSYNPMYEDALVFDEYAHMGNEKFLLSAKPIYTQTVGNSIKRYFNIHHLCSMNVQENGTGNIDSLWFQDISAIGSMYSSILAFNPIQKTYGALIYGALMLPADFAITINFAAVARNNNMYICESDIMNLGQVPGFSTLTQAFTSTGLNYGKICGTQSQGGVDDIQIKFLKNFSLCDDASLFGDIYALVGVPTGRGSQAVYLFEPIVGSNHAQFGLGLNAEKEFELNMCDQFSLYGEFKWRYGFKATETRSFDMTPNGQWSRYMLFTTPTASANPFFAINNLTFAADVTPRSSLDLLLAAHVGLDKFSFELGYNFWYRQAEIVCPCISLPDVGIADLVGIAQLANANPVTVTTSSTANISQGVLPNSNQMVHDATYTLVTPANINVCSGAQAASCSNAVFGSIGYTCDNRWHPIDLGVNASYEGAANSNTASVVSVWVNVDIQF